ncbi:MULTISPECIES: alpha/beta fold hydrolase [Streptosporangium]|uniref:2-succinyl-6-hydroxy-2, 4-cyclohexadiene-1-carboxylate synthase n=1 Tax=Streptosporangium brasiliense TaxID=47480 RepID=A0ABT9R092_9ACTN|nr:alpha/beta hydrolase [Streptosporangium brasiliense]MDP9862629.1 2-succinyl-6-hydroxy-2,4-cyclohexadiene-1-carboxylate synthase [Streptosporangium brasiliense]
MNGAPPGPPGGDPPGQAGGDPTGPPGGDPTGQAGPAVTGDWDGLAVIGSGRGGGAGRGDDTGRDDDTGRGGGVLWLHGYTMGAAIWPPLWRHLPGRGHVAVDLPWHGRSRPLRGGEDRAALADLLAGRALEAGVRHVVALSFGTVVALEMALRHPRAFASWTLAAPSYAGGPQERAVERHYLDLALLHRSAGSRARTAALWMSCRPIFGGIAARPAAHSALADVIGRHAWDELAGAGIRPLLEPRQPVARLSAVAAPLLVLVGDGELPAHRACAETIAAAAPGGALRVLPGTGHLALLEEPRAALRIVGAHLAGAEHGGPPDPAPAEVSR